LVYGQETPLSQVKTYAYLFRKPMNNMNTTLKADQKSHIINGEIFYCPSEAHPLEPEVLYKDKKAIKVLLNNYATENNFSITTFRSDKQKL
jgi:hypothetical protein